MLYIQNSTSWWWAGSLLETCRGYYWNKLKVNSASCWFILYGLICRPNNTWQTCWKKTDNTNTSKADNEASRNTVPNFKVHTCKARALVQNVNQEDYTVKLLFPVVTKEDVLVNISCCSHSTRMRTTVANAFKRTILRSCHIIAAVYMNTRI